MNYFFQADTLYQIQSYYYHYWHCYTGIIIGTVIRVLILPLLYGYYYWHCYTGTIIGTVIRVLLLALLYGYYYWHCYTGIIIGTVIRVLLLPLLYGYYYQVHVITVFLLLFYCFTYVFSIVGVVRGRVGCGSDSEAVTDQTFWVILTGSLQVLVSFSYLPLTKNYVTNPF